MDTVNHLAQFWSKEILKDSPSIPLNDLSKAPIPEKLLSDLTIQTQASIQQEVERVIGNPIFTFAEGRDAVFREQLLSLFSQNIVISERYLQEIIEQVFRKLIDGWRTEPISFRKAADDPQTFAAEIFQRASIIITSPESGDRTLSAEVLAIICEASGLKTLGDAAMIETELHPVEFTSDSFVLLTRRLLKLRERFSVGRRLVQYEGTGRTISEVPLTGKEAATAPPPPIQAPQAVVVPSEQPVTDAAPSVEQAVPVEADLPDSTTVESIPSEPIPEIGMETETTGAAPPPLFVAPPKPVSKPGLEGPGAVLYAALMAEDALAYFSEILFDKDTVAYQRLAYHIARQKKVSNAVTLADNELFVREIPSNTIPAVKLMELIQNNFKEPAE